MVPTKIIGLAVSSTAVVAAAAATPALATQSHHAPVAAVVLDCSGQAQTQPGTYLIACGDGNNYLSGLHWTDWGAGSATATGLDNANDCTPNCAAGTFDRYPVSVTLSGLEPWAGHSGTDRYTQLTVHYTGQRPAGTAADVTVALRSPSA